MKSINASKPLVFVPILSACAALVAGCHSTKSHGTAYYSETPYYVGSSQTSGMGATTSEPSSTRMAGEAQTAEGQVAIPLYEEQVVVGTRNVESGGVRLRKQVTTETVNQPVQIRRETIVVDREAAPSGSGQASLQGGQQSGSLGTPFEGGEIVIRLHNEEPVVETRVVPSGKIVVQTRTNAEQTTVQRQVRKEKIDVEKMGDSQNVIINEGVGAAPGGSQEMKGTGKSKEDTSTKTPDTSTKAPVTTKENEGFPRPQPDGRETFPALDKNIEKP